MYRDEIIEEVWKNRDAYVKQHGHDLGKIRPPASRRGQSPQSAGLTISVGLVAQTMRSGRRQSESVKKTDLWRTFRLLAVNTEAVRFGRDLCR